MSGDLHTVLEKEKNAGTPVTDDFNKDGHPIYFVAEIIWDSVINYAYLCAPFRTFMCLCMYASLTG